MFGLYVASAIAAVIGFVLIGGAIRAKWRREQFQRLAAEQGWSYERDGGGLASALAHFPLFSQGRRRRADNVLRSGSGPDELWIFDYRYTVGSGKHSHTYRQTALVFPYLDANLPAFELRPENILHKLGTIFGFQDIDLPSHPQFSAKFLLRGKEEPAIRELFAEGVVQAFHDQSICVEGDGSCLLFYRQGKIIAVEKLPDFLDTSRDLRDAMVARAASLGWTARETSQEAALV